MQKTWQKLRERPDLWPRYLMREQVIDTIRAFLKSRNYHEVFTPVLVPVPSAEANLEVFETRLRTVSGPERRAFLIMSPEYALKKLITAGIGKAFEITRCFRNEEEVSRAHSPEFTMLEWYHTGVDYRVVMEEFEQLFVEIIKKTHPEIDLRQWQYQGETYDLSLPWPRISVAEAFTRFAGVETETLLDEPALKEAAKSKGYQADETTTWEELFYQIFFNEIEPKLKDSHRPYIIYDYPLSQAALARKKAVDPRFAERFEVFLAGLELGNCFSELTDAAEQAERFTKDLAQRQRLGKTIYPMDEELIEALKQMPQAAGIAVGVDRLVMLAADTTSVAETLFFPADEEFGLRSV